MLYLQEFHIDLALESVSEVVVEGISQHSVDQLFDEFYQSILLNLVVFSQLHIQILNLGGYFCMSTV